MTVTDNQIIFAAFCGMAGILASFMPFMAVAINFITNYDKGDDSSSALSFLVWATGAQFLVSVVFHNTMRFLDITVGKSGLKVFGEGGAFDIFWKVDIVYATVMSETLTVIIKVTRDVTILINAFLPFIVVAGGAVWGYNLAARQKHTKGSNSDHDDVVNVGVKILLGIAVTVVTYAAWSRFAAYTLHLPSAVDRQVETMAHEAAVQYWRQAVGIKTGAKEASKITIQ